MKTKHKVVLARLVWRAVKSARKFSGSSMVGFHRRSGVNWKLDLDEGIDFSIYLLGGFEVPTVRFYRRMIRPGEVVLDIGANIGAHTLPFAKCVAPSGKVHAFEATEFAFDKLAENAALNPELEHIIVSNHTLLGAPGDIVAPGEIYSSWPLDPSVKTHPKLVGCAKPLSGASLETLDDYCERMHVDRVDWIKIDVDGNETPVLQGATKTLRKFRPKLIMEFSPYICREAGYDFGELVGMVRDAGYDFLDLESGHTLPADAGKLDRLIPDGAGLNIFLRPIPLGGEESNGKCS